MYVICPFCNEKIELCENSLSCLVMTLRQHLEEKHSELKYKCTICGSTFNRTNNLYSHMLHHIILNEEENLKRCVQLILISRKTRLPLVISNCYELLKKLVRK